MNICAHYGKNATLRARELSRSLHEETKTAPSLHSVIRQCLLARSFTEIQIEQHLKGLGALNRYQNAFALLFAMALRDGLTINSPLDAFVGLLLELHAVSPSQACNAYSALLLVPGFHDVKYHPLLKQAKKAWNKHSPRYAAFWDPVPVFVAFLNTSYDVKYIAHARIRLIMLWRFLGLFRSIDLSRTKRQVSSIGERRFVVVQRKKKPDYRWEEILVLHLHAWSPWHALCTYVELTAPLVAPGSALLIALHRPYLPLTADTIGSLTRRELQRLGVDTSVFGPHTTRGAFVEFLCFLQLPSEVVAALGQWDNLEAFCKHYLRVGASGEARQALNNFLEQTVHNSSLGSRGSSAVPHTHQEPVLQVTRGGSGTNREHQDTSEPVPPKPKAPKRKRSIEHFRSQKLPRVEGMSSRGRSTTRFVVNDSDSSEGSVYVQSEEDEN